MATFNRPEKLPRALREARPNSPGELPAFRGRLRARRLRSPRRLWPPRPGHAQRLPLPTHEHAFQGADVAVVAPPPDGDVAHGRDAIVRRVHVNPADARAVERDPGVRRINTPQLGLARRRVRFQVATDVARGQAERPQAGYLELREVLTRGADASPVPPVSGRVASPSEGCSTSVMFRP